MARRALYGARWKSPLATALGLKSVTIRSVVNGGRAVPYEWTHKVKGLLEKHAYECQKILKDLKEDGL